MAAEPGLRYGRRQQSCARLQRLERMSMATHHLHPVPPRGTSDAGCELITDPEELGMVQRDAAAMQGRGARGLVVPRSEAELARYLIENPEVAVLAQGALTSLTGGATPDDDVVVSFRKLNALQVVPEEKRAIVGAGLVLASLQESLAGHGLFYPPAPTHDGASIGGNVATNAGGAASFKYGTTRQWVRGLRVMLRSGDVLALRRGEQWLSPGESLHIDGREKLTIPIPTYRSPRIKKSSAGYFIQDQVDLVDLFIGSEGTLGFITEIELALVDAPKLITGLVFVPSTAQALALTERLRECSVCTRRNRDPKGLDVRSIEFFDQRCLRLLADEGKLGAFSLTIPDDAQACLLFEQEVAPSDDYDTIVDSFIAASEGRRDQANPIAELFDVLAHYEVTEQCELALPNDQRRQKQLAQVREAIPLSVSEYLLRQKKSHPGIHKTAGDMIVPFEHFPKMLAHYDEAFAKRGIDVAVFGHISDGNVHPNALPRNEDDVRRAQEALVELGKIASSLGGCPLSEHGVGKHPLKKKLLEDYWGIDCMNQMRELKAGFDPRWTLGRGVFFEP